MRFGEIREILDYHTECCRNCDEGSYQYCSHPDCDTFVARIMREEIMALLDKEEVKTDSLSSVPCKLYFKGQVDKLPENAKEGDCYITVIRQRDGFYCWEDSRTFYWYDNQWNELKNPPKEYRINYV